MSGTDNINYFFKELTLKKKLLLFLISEMEEGMLQIIPHTKDHKGSYILTTRTIIHTQIEQLRRNE